MKHRTGKKILGRKAAPRKALLENLAASLILYEKVKTTEAKAKTVKPIVEKLITKGKNKNLNAKRELEKVLPDKKAVRKVLDVLGPRYKDRNGGYTRITKLKIRQGDNAPVVQIEFV